MNFSESEGKEKIGGQSHVQDVVLEDIAFNHVELFIPDVIPVLEIEHRNPDDGLAAGHLEIVADREVKPIVAWKSCTVLGPSTTRSIVSNISFYH